MDRLIDYFAFKRVPGQLPELDGLRGLAIILVLLRHGTLPYPLEQKPLFLIGGWDFGTFMTNGWIGVDLFFVLSGFLITHHILRSRDKHGGEWKWKPYLQKRALRIVPAYLAVLFSAVFGFFAFYPVSPDEIWFRVAYHLLFLQDYLPSDIVVTFWSLGVEEKFYLLAPFLAVALLKLSSVKKRALGVVALLFLGVGARMLTAYLNPDVVTYVDFFPVFRSPFHMTLDGLLLGVLIAFVYRARDDQPDIVSRTTAHGAFWLGAATFLFMSCATAMMNEITWWDKTLQPLVVALGFAGMTFGLLFGGGPAQLFRFVGLFFLARVSYTLYLVHFPLIRLSIEVANQMDPGDSLFATFFMVYLVFSLVTALVYHYAVEKPFLLLKDRIRE